MCDSRHCPACSLAQDIQAARIELAGLVRGSKEWKAARQKIEDLISRQARLYQDVDMAERTVRAMIEEGIPFARFSNSAAN